MKTTNRLLVAVSEARRSNGAFASNPCTPWLCHDAQTAHRKRCRATPLQRCLWVGLIWLVASFDTLAQQAAARLSMRGTQEVATQRAVVNFAELPQQETRDEVASDPTPV